MVFLVGHGAKCSGWDTAPSVPGRTRRQVFWVRHWHRGVPEETLHLLTNGKKLKKKEALLRAREMARLVKCLNTSMKD